MDVGQLFITTENRRQFADELKQKQAATNELIQRILYSKRLLVDHVEALEQCMHHLRTSHDVTDSRVPLMHKSGSREIFTARNTSLLLGGTLLEHFITPKSLRFTLLPSLLVTTGFSALYMVKKIFVFRNRMVVNELQNLIRTIDEFGNCIRRNMTYFNEILIMKQQELIESRQIERAWDCITAAKEVTEILYDATRKLENSYPIPVRFAQYYSPMEELRECEYFKNNVTDYSPKHIKDFNNIFAYVQSQFLLRLALTICTQPSLSRLSADLVKLECLIRQLVLEEENHFRNLTIELKKKKQQELETLNASKAMQNRSGPVAVLQDSSLKLSACMVAVAGECQALDSTLQRLTVAEAEHQDNGKQLLELANNMRSIESALSVCFDDFQRLMLVYNKFLSSKLDDKSQHKSTPHKSTTTSDEEYPESFLRVEISQSPMDAADKDDFYAYMYDEQQAKREREAAVAEKPARDMEILNFEKRITKGKFRPVLKQLKNRIDPIRHEMLEKERQVLTAKGINVDELFGNETRQENKDRPSKVPKKKSVTISEHVRRCAAASTDEEEEGETEHVDAPDTESDDSADSAELEFKRRSKQLKERDNFAEMRNFLAQKPAINIFNVNAPMQPANALGTKEVLESEC